MPQSMLPAIEKLSSHSMCFFSARKVNRAMTAADTATTASDVQEPEKENSPFPETKEPT